MSRAIAPLSDAACRSAKLTERVYKLFDGDGLYLLIQLNGRNPRPALCMPRRLPFRAASKVVGRPVSFTTKPGIFLPVSQGLDIENFIVFRPQRRRPY